jgi:hypothetical protein
MVGELVSFTDSVHLKLRSVSLWVTLELPPSVSWANCEKYETLFESLFLKEENWGMNRFWDD